MTQFSVWSETVLTQIANDRNNCSICVIIYVLAQIAFNTFVFDGSENGNEDSKSNESERDSHNGLAQIQSRALALLNEIKESMIENVIIWQLIQV